MNLPSIVKKQHLTHCWEYRNEEGDVIALVARYDDHSKPKQKKWFHQYHMDLNKNWVEGAVTPSPLFGIDSLPKAHSDEMVYIFEGEKCAQAAHHLGLVALTSMMGSNQSLHADWAILAKFRHLKDFVLVPDNDAPGDKYMRSVYGEIQRACPNANVWVLPLSLQKKGADLVDWIHLTDYCLPGWNGFDPIDDPYSEYLKQAFKVYEKSNLVSAEKYFVDSIESSPAFEGEPEPLKNYLAEVKACPIDTLPFEVKRWIECSANQMQILPDYLAASLLVQLGSVIGRKRALMMRAESKWLEFPNLWGMVIGCSGSQKTGAISQTVKFVEALANKARAKHQAAYQKFKKEHQFWEARKKIEMDAYKKACEKKTEPIDDHISDPPKEPKQKRYKSNDATIEKLGVLLSDNPQGMLIYRDELSGWFDSFLKNGRENDRQFYLEGWNGNQPFDSDRIGREIPHIDALCISILGGIQPGLIEPLVYGAIKGKTGDDGFIQRFQVMVWPEMKLDWEISKDTDVTFWEPYISQIFEILDGLDFTDGQPVVLSFNREAQQVFDAWHASLEMKLRKGELPPHLQAHFAKYKKLLPALCLILEHIDAALRNQVPNEISKETIEKALIWLQYFESHAYRIYGSAANAVPQAASNLISRIQSGVIKIPFTAREIYHGRHWTGLSNATEVKEVLEFLIEKNYVCETHGKTKTQYWVHPQILEA